MVDYLRKSSEALILLVVVASPWAFGSVHAISRYFVTAAIGLIALFWALELFIAPRRVLSRFQIPILLMLAIVGLQMAPIGSLAALLSPQAAEMKAELMPQQLETLADGRQAEVPFWSARGKISVYPAETLRRFYWLALMGVLLTRVQDLASVETLRRLCFACLINGSILSYFAVFQHFTTDEPGKIYWTYQSLGAAFGPFVNRNHFAFYINICFGLSLGLVGSRSAGRIKSLHPDDIVEGLKDSLSLWMISVLVFMLGAVILCSSRGGLISLFSGMLITAVFIAATGTFQQSWKWFALAAGIFAVAAGMQTWLGFDFVDSRYAMHDDNRSQVWWPLLQLVPQFPVTGTGLGTLAYVEPFTRWSSDQLDTFLENAHNEYLQLLLETGVPGLLCGLALIGMLIAKIAARVRSSRHNAWLYVGALFGLCTISLHSFVEFGFAIPAIAVLAAVLFGHVAGLSRIKPRGPLAGGIPARMFAVLLLVLAFFAVRDAKSFDMAMRSWRLGQRVQKTGDEDQELQHYLNALAYAPNNAEILLDCSRIQLDPDRAHLLKDEGNVLYAQADLIRARELCPFAAEAQFLIGQYVETFQQAEEELVYYERALKPRPVDATLWFIVGEIYLERGDTEQAAEHFRRSLELENTHLERIMEYAVEQFDESVIDEKLMPTEHSLPLIGMATWYERRGADQPEEQVEAINKRVADLRQRALDTPELTQPNSGVLHYRKAVLLESQGRMDEAISAYRMSLNYEPTQIRWRLQLARLYGEQREYEEAHRQIKRVLQTRSGYGPAIRLRDELLEDESLGGATGQSQD